MTKKISDLIDMTPLFDTASPWSEQPGSLLRIHFDPDTEEIVEEVLIDVLWPEYQGWGDDEDAFKERDAQEVVTALQKVIDENKDKFDAGITLPANDSTLRVIGYRTLPRDHERYAGSLTPLLDKFYPQRTWEKVAPEDMVELPEDAQITREGWSSILGFEYSLRETQSDVKPGRRLQNWDEDKAIMCMCDLGKFTPSHEMETLGFPVGTPHRSGDHPEEENRILVTVYPEGQEPVQFSAPKSHGFIDKFHPSPRTMN